MNDSPAGLTATPSPPHGNAPADPSLTHCERSHLDNGCLVCLRILEPDDRAPLIRGFERLSPTSRYRRFFAAKNALSDDELDFLTRFDGFNHVAVAGFELDADDRPGDVVGVARFVRLGPALPEAEVAIAVIDEYQHLGLGRLLLGRLVQIASEVGVRTLRFQFLAENQPMREFIRFVWPDAAFLVEQGMATARFSIAHASDRPPALA